MNEHCHICGHANLTEAMAYGRLARVTSDTKPWPAGGRLVACRNCGAVTKPVDAKFLDEAERIYKEYDLYHFNEDVDQNIFTPTGIRSRSSIVVERLAEAGIFSSTGKLLDVGCGRGAFLGAFAKAVQGWTLCGSERSGANGKEVLAIPGAQFSTLDLDELPADFNVVSMTHVLEHIPEPFGFLSKIAARLEPSGLLFIQVPNLDDNLFDILVADHSTHFTPASMRRLLAAAGFEIVVLATDWIPKEISVVARYTGRKVNDSEERPFPIEETVNQLSRFASEAKELADDASSFGIFGTSIAGVWLDAQLHNVAAFFVDEDAKRQGRTLFGRPVLAPKDIPADAIVYVPMPPNVAERIATRLSRPGCDFRYPQLDK